MVKIVIIMKALAITVGLVLLLPNAIILADTYRTKTQVALSNVEAVIYQYGESYDGKLPQTWEDFDPFWEIGTIEQLLGSRIDNAVLLLTQNENDYSINDNRIFAISKVPRPDGTFDAIQMSKEGIIGSVLTRFTLKQLQAVGLTSLISKATPAENKKETAKSPSSQKTKDSLKTPSAPEPSFAKKPSTPEKKPVKPDTADPTPDNPFPYCIFIIGGIVVVGLIVLLKRK